MKILLLHTDYIEYEAKEKAVPQAPDLTDTKGRLDEALVVFVAVEKDDESSVEQVVNKATEEIVDVAKKVSATNIMIYPYAHLSPNLAGIDEAQDILRKLKISLTSQYTVHQSPFGWYKAFKISCKGHPLAELSREIRPSQPQPVTEKPITSTWYIMTPDGKLRDANDFDFSNHEELKKFYKYETVGNKTSNGQPAHIDLMQKLEFVDYEPGSDSGQMRWYPKGKLIKTLLEYKVEEMCLNAGAMAVETPIMYDTEHPALRKYLTKFPARQYRVHGDKDKQLFMRFAACFGQYLMAHDMVISYRNLPVRLFELAKSFRKEQHGELSGIKRLRAFTMPDMHTMCADEQQTIDEFENQLLLALEWVKLIELDGEIALRFVRPFYEEQKEFAIRIARKIGRPILVEMWDKQYFYFTTKFEFNVSDSVGKWFALSTVQIDTENPQQFEITYTDRYGHSQYPLLLHTSISGGIDRCLCGLLEKEARNMLYGQKAMLPFWLSPTHVRLLPVNKEFVGECQELAKRINGRADVDDRNISLSKKIRDGEKEWVPIIVVYGEKERQGTFQPRCRFDCPSKLSLDDLNKLLGNQLQEFPMQQLSLPVLLSQRPNFR